MHEGVTGRWSCVRDQGVDHGGFTMKVVIAAQADNMDSLVERRFGRAPWLIIADGRTEGWEAVDNRANIENGGSIGVQTANTAAALDAQVAIAVDIGPKAHEMLSMAGISVCHAEDGLTVREAFTRFMTKGLVALQSETSPGGTCPATQKQMRGQKLKLKQKRRR